MRWNQGAGSIERLLAERDLERVPPSRDQADRLIEQARKHAAAAAAIAELDPVGAYQLAYDGARKALTAILENQGLRPTSQGGHVVVYHALRAQLEPPMGKVLRPFNRMRRTRNENQYPSDEGTGVVTDDVTDALSEVAKLIDLAAKVLDQMGAF